MIAGSFLWAIFTVIAAAGQTARNALQRGLTQTIGTVGATHVRLNLASQTIPCPTLSL